MKFAFEKLVLPIAAIGDEEGGLYSCFFVEDLNFTKIEAACKGLFTFIKAIDIHPEPVTIFRCVLILTLVYMRVR